MTSGIILSYKEVLAELGDLRHLLLGNGFSIACKPDLFRYDKLFNRADFSKLKRVRSAFERLSTTNFENVIRALRSYALISNLYAPQSPDAKTKATEDAHKLKELLVRTIADSHPDLPASISRSQYLKCRSFLRGYKSINTLNYDLLLYWTLMQDELGDAEIPCDDGFRKPAGNHDSDYVTWDPDNSYSQSVRYLHGALHLFDTGAEMKKFTWINTQIPLIEQIRAALKKEFYPVFVSEGTSKEKLERIRHNDYLSKMYRAFTALGGDIVVYGHSLDSSDDHFFRDRIGYHGKCKRLYFSLFGDPESTENRQVIRRANALPGLRPLKKPKLEVKFFSAESAKVW